MSSIRSAITTVRNFLVNLVSQPHGGDGDPNYTREFQPQGESYAGGRKRVASRVFEPEITDDEDDVSSGIRFPIIKRLRGDKDWEMSEKSKEQARYVTRGSGLNPAIEEPSSSKSVLKQLQVPESSVDAQLKGRESNNSKMQASKISIASFGRKAAETKRKEIEVITLDGETTSIPSSSSNGHRSTIVPVRANRHQDWAFKPRLTTTMKYRDSNRFTRCLKEVGQKLLRPTTPSAIRPLEMQEYKKLLEAYDYVRSGSITSRFALSKSKLRRHEVEVMYKRFDSSPTSGAVSITMDGRILADSLNESQKSSAWSKSVAVMYPRLFSTPNEDMSLSLASKPSSSALPPAESPVVVDLEADSKLTAVEKCISPISPITSRRSYDFAAHGNVTLAGNFTNLEDALNKSCLPEHGPSDSAEVLQISAEGTDETAPDDDLSIIAEKIVNKSRNISVNTLALEQTSCPYVQKSWLTESKTRSTNFTGSLSTWREENKHRESRIREEAGTIDVLRRESTLEKDLEERIRKKLTLTEIIVLEEPPAKLPELTDDILDVIEYAKARGNDNEVLAQVRLLKDTIGITRGDVRTLGPSQWLNDNVINTYMGLIVLRSKLDNYPNVYAFQTFFYPKLLKEGYSNSLKRWTRKDDIFAHDLIILPIHLGLHWCLACIDLRKKIIRYYDSLGGDNNKCLNSLLEYICREMKERKQTDMDKSEWKLVNVKGIPQQQNGSDCGMFACKFAEYLSRDADFTFAQENMPYYRDRMIYELIKQDLMYP